MHNQEQWTTELKRLFREPGDFQYQICDNQTYKLLTVADKAEYEFFDGVEAIIPIEPVVFGDNLLTYVENGAWVLDGTAVPVFENNVYDTNFSHTTPRYKTTASLNWPIVIDDFLGTITFADFKNPKQVMTTVWDPHTSSYPSNFTIQGVEITGEDPNTGEWTYSVKWTKNVSGNTSALSVVDVSDVDLSLSSALLITVLRNDWSHSGFYPRLTSVILGNTEISFLQNKNILNVSESAEANLCSDSLATNDITVEVSNLEYERDVDSDLLLQDTLPGNSKLYYRYGQTYQNRNVYYTDYRMLEVNDYQAPTDTQSIQITGKDTLSSELSTEIYNRTETYYTANGKDQYRLDAILGILNMSAKYPIVDESTWPSEIQSIRTSTFGALPQGTTVNQVYQYVAQLIGAVAYSNRHGDIVAKRVSDILSESRNTIDDNNLISWPAITLNSNVNKIEVVKYKIQNNYESLYNPRFYEGNETISTGNHTFYVKWSEPYDYFEDSPKQTTLTMSDGSPLISGLSLVGSVVYTEYSAVMTIRNTTGAKQDIHVTIGGYASYTKEFQTIKVVNDTLDTIEIFASWDSPKRSPFLAIDTDEFDLDSMEVNTGTRCMRAKITPLRTHTSANPGILSLKGIDVDISTETVVYWDNSANAPGETLTIDNPLIDSDELVNRVGSFVKSMIDRRRYYKIDYTGDPLNKPLSRKQLISTYETVDNLLVTKATLNFNGGYSGTLEGKVYE